MKRTGLAALLLVFAADLSRAAEAAPLAAVDTVVAAINRARSANDPKALDALLAKDLTAAERAAILQSEQAVCAEARRPMSELLVPRLTILAVIAISPDVTEVDGSNVQLIETMPGMARRGTVVLILKKEGGNWRIAGLRSHTLL